MNLITGNMVYNNKNYGKISKKLNPGFAFRYLNYLKGFCKLLEGSINLRAIFVRDSFDNFSFDEVKNCIQ